MLDEIRLAYQEASKSPDPSNQNGALILDANRRILSLGYNRFPGGVAPVLDDRDEKLRRIVHAEADAVYKLLGFACQPYTMVCPWACCSKCALPIICAGIKELVVHKQRMELTPERWMKDVEYGHALLREAGVTIIVLEAELYPGIIVNGEPWTEPSSSASLIVSAGN